MHLLVIRFTSRSLEIHLEDKCTEDEEVQNEITRDDRKQHQPVGLSLAGQDAVEDQVDETVGERCTDSDLQDVAERKGKSRKSYMDRKQHRSKEQECELNRLGNAGQEGCQRNGEQQGACLFLLLRSCAGVHCQSCAGKTAHHERIFADEEARCVNRELCRVRGRELCKEDVLRAFYEDAVDHHGAADAGLPERHVENVVQTERDKSTLDTAVNECSEVARGLYETAQCVDAALDDRPDNEHKSADNDTADHTNDRDKTCARKE